MQASGHGFLRDGDPSPPPAPDRVCARCGLARPPATTWPEGPVCDPCSTAALRRRGPCSGCGRQRRLVAPPGSTAITCADCSDAPAPAGHVCTECCLLYTSPSPRD